MPADSKEIYGLDSNDFAEACAAKALSNADINAEGACTGATSSKGTSDGGSGVDQLGDVVMSKEPARGDGRARTAGNHGKQG